MGHAREAVGRRGGGLRAGDGRGGAGALGTGRRRGGTTDTRHGGQRERATSAAATETCQHPRRACGPPPTATARPSGGSRSAAR
ncbi:hypothetical protein NKH77_18630 [Streptomyces sp. M19]